MLIYSRCSLPRILGLPMHIPPRQSSNRRSRHAPLLSLHLPVETVSSHWTSERLSFTHLGTFLSRVKGDVHTYQRLPNLSYARLPSLHSLNTSMSDRPPATASSSNFKVIFEKALKGIQKNDPTRSYRSSPLQPAPSMRLSRGHSTILQNQVDQFIQSRSGDERLKKWLDPTINVLYAFSGTLGEGVGLVNVNYLRGCIPLIPSTGFLSRQSDFCWCWCPPLGKCPRLFTRARLL
jgi:hypothetical protein